MEIALEGVSKTYGTVAAVRQMTLAVHTGEFLTLLGPSGCGKTTILRLLAGLERPDQGHIRFGGEVVDDVPPEERGVGLVFQNYALFPHMTVAQNISYGLRRRGGRPGRRWESGRPPGGRSDEMGATANAAQRVQQLLELVGLPGYEHRYPAELSAGQQQRVAIARALAPQPQALLLDEPLSALDARLRDRLRLEIRRLQQRLGLTLVYVTHDQAEALSMSDRIAVMREGQLRQVGTPVEIYDHPRDAFVATFVGEANLIPVGQSVYVVRPERLQLISAEPQVGPPVDPRPDAASQREQAPPAGRTSGPMQVMVGGRVQLKAEVIGSEYLGATVRLHLRWGKQELVVQHSQGTAPQPGTAAVLQFDLHQVVAIPSPPGNRQPAGHADGPIALD